jgi:microcystin-dependent protein
MADPYLGEIRIFAGNFAPVGWALCDGQLLAIRQNTALFSLLGTYYGGDGKTTFGLPNLQASVALGQGAGPGLSAYQLGESGGSPDVTLTQQEVPAHTHTLNAGQPGRANSNSVTGNVPGGIDSNTPLFGSGAANQAMPQCIAPLTSSQPHENMQPYLAVNYIICLSGVYPPRS